jgi:CheY-like chemotaxis protein
VLLDRLVNEMAGMLRRVIGEDVRFELELEPGLPTVRIDPGQLEQVVLNLVVNARDAMPRGGSLRIAARPVEVDDTHGHALSILPGPYVALSVSDSGTGIPPEVRERIFEPFFTTKPRGKGTGLGLATSWGIVRQSGGAISLDSEVGRGTTFTLWLPVEIGTPENAEVKRVPTPLPTGSETVLLVEDEPAVRKVTARILRESGYHVLQAGDGIEALVVANAFPDHISLLLTDVVMPGMNGRELAELITASRPGIGVLYTSGYDDDLLGQGIPIETQLLQKPVPPEVLVRRVRAAIDG